MVRSRLTYSCQTWNVTARQMERINSTYSTMLRKMIKGGYRRKTNNEWSFGLSNKDPHNICGTENMDIYVGRQQQKYLAHIARQPNNALTKRLLFNCDESRKPGPKLTLERSTEDTKEPGRPMVLTAQCPAMLDRVNFMYVCMTLHWPTMNVVPSHTGNVLP